MINNPSWLDLAKELQEVKQSGQLLRALWHAYEGSTDYGVWLLLPEGPETNEARARFGVFAARAIQKLGISPLPTPLARQHFADWDRYCQIEEDMARSSGRAIDLSKAVPYGLGVVDKDAVDPYVRAWLEWLRQNNPAFRSSEGRLSLGDRHYKTFSGEIADLCGASDVACLRLARDEVGAGPTRRLVPTTRKRLGGAHTTPKQIRERAASRQGVVTPILKKKSWTRGRLGTVSGVGKATVYGYLNGTRNISRDNRQAIAEVLDLKIEQLPH